MMNLKLGTYDSRVTPPLVFPKFGAFFLFRYGKEACMTILLLPCFFMFSGSAILLYGLKIQAPG